MKYTFCILLFLAILLPLSKANYYFDGCIDNSICSLFSKKSKCDTAKIDENKFLFGRSYLKKHFELHGEMTIVNEKKRNKWILKAISNLNNAKKARHFDKLEMNELIHENFYQASYRLIGKGMILFDDGSYLKLMNTSAHSLAEIGDITLAINQHGDVFINQGHICGGIIHFKTHQKATNISAQDFLTNFNSDTDDDPWYLYAADQNKITNK